MILMQKESNAIRIGSLVPREDVRKTFVSLNAQQHMIRSELGQLHQPNRMRKRDESDAQMTNVQPRHRRNLTRREYRTEIPLSSQTTSIHPPVREYVSYVQPGANQTVIFAPETPIPTRHENSSSILPDTPMFTGNSQASTTASWQLSKLPPPQNSKSNIWGRLRAVRFWRELYRHIEDDQVLGLIRPKRFRRNQGYPNGPPREKPNRSFIPYF